MVLSFIDVLSVLIALGFVLLVLSIVSGVFLSIRRRVHVSPPESSILDANDALDREERHRMVDERGTELIERRIELDTRRGTLGSYFNVDEEFTRLERRLQSGEISDEEFEAEKIRLLTEGHA